MGCKCSAGIHPSPIVEDDCLNFEEASMQIGMRYLNRKSLLCQLPIPVWLARIWGNGTCPQSFRLSSTVINDHLCTFDCRGELILYIWKHLLSFLSNIPRRHFSPQTKQINCYHICL
ncbi:hypothetical protein IV203_030151 [Nitzschia inconspicua]|uniref:Uncharacterized protein n=1 Tax=Nitzschia inconspicua TaxID=303405 RepID=A0A9K3Q1X8_9STRA|nr:hypothetical protein IV203_004894 [Nitzschia inconspicua]KAG7367480.1 hypothetical protein IV203_030151 [Nitzschia inconspicua]